MSAVDQLLLQRPARRKVVSFVEANGRRAERLRNHVVVAFPLEHVWIRKVKRFAEHDLLIGPIESVLADGETDYAELRFAVQHFEEHVPATVVVKHERIGNELG